MIETILARPRAYRLFQQLVGAARARKILLAEYIQPAPGDKLLDLGCGPADILNDLSGVQYTGYDIDPQFIRSAQRRLGAQGSFGCGDEGRAMIGRESGAFDVVLALGVLHHLDDTSALELLALARRSLRAGGRLITCDGCRVAGQSFLARWLLARDCGKFVRTPEDYLRLASAQFSMAQPALRTDLLRVPYTHLIMRCFP